MLFGSAFASLFEFCVATVCITKEGPKPLFCYAGNRTVEQPTRTLYAYGGKLEKPCKKE